MWAAAPGVWSPPPPPLFTLVLFIPATVLSAPQTPWDLSPSWLTYAFPFLWLALSHQPALPQTTYGNPTICYPGCSKIWNSLSTLVTPQVEYSTPDLPWGVAVKTWLHRTWTTRSAAGSGWRAEPPGFVRWWTLLCGATEMPACHRTSVKATECLPPRVNPKVNRGLPPCGKGESRVGCVDHN